MEIIKTGKALTAQFECTWCGTVWTAKTSEKGVYKYNMLGRAYPRMKCPLCAEKYVVGEFISGKGGENGE